MFLVYAFHLPENISFFSLGISLVIKAAGCNSAKAPTLSTTARLEAETRQRYREKRLMFSPNILALILSKK